VGITGKYANLRDAYASIDKALEHCGRTWAAMSSIVWIETTDINEENVGQAAGRPGRRDRAGRVRFARRRGQDRVRQALPREWVPYLGICLGFQVAVIEFARNVLGIADASSAPSSSRT
jgi:CTP synthase